MTSQTKVAIVGMGSSGQSAAKLAMNSEYDVLCIDRNDCQVPEGCTFALESYATLENVSLSGCPLVSHLTMHHSRCVGKGYSHHFRDQFCV